MKTTNQAAGELTKFIRENQPEICWRWAQGLLEMDQGGAHDLEESEITALSQGFLEGLETLPGSGQANEEIPASWRELTRRLGARPSRLVEALSRLRGAMADTMQTKAPDRQGELMAQMNERLDGLTARLLDEHSANLQKQVEKANAHVTLLNYITGMVASSLDLMEVLTQAGAAIAAAAGVSHCYFYMISEEGDLMIFVPATYPSLESWNMSGYNLTRFSRDYLSPSDALWQVLEEKQPVSIFDAQHAPNTTHNEGLRKAGIQSFLLVPCLSKGEVAAVAVVQTFEKQKDFTAEEIEAALAIASAVAPAIENARLHQKVEQLAALEERARMARAMHDSLAQTLGAMLLKASQTGDLLDKDRVDAARNNINELSQIAREAYTDVREAIFNLRARPPAGVDFLPYLGTYLATYQTCFGIATSLEAGERVTAGLSDQNSDQIMYIIQEALTNIRKHAGARHIQVSLKPAGNMLLVEIVDDGSGFNPAQVEQEEPAQHLGLQIMEERAAATGGRLELESLPGQGTCIRVLIPLEVTPATSTPNSMEDV